MRTAACLAALAALLLVTAPSAQAATTTLLLQFSNDTGHGLKVQVNGPGFNSTQIIPNGGQHPFNIQLDAHFMTDRTYTFYADIYNGDTSQILGRLEASEQNTWDAGPKVKSCSAACAQGVNCQIDKQQPDRGTCQFFITVGQ